MARRRGEPAEAAARLDRGIGGIAEIFEIGAGKGLELLDGGRRRFGFGHGRHRSRTPEDLGYVLAWAAASSWSTNWWPLADPSVFVICPEHAEMFRAAGWSKQRLRQFMFEAVHKLTGQLRRGETTPFVHAADPAAQVPRT